MDGAKFTGGAELKRVLAELFALPTRDIKAVLRRVGKEAAPEALTAHYERNKGRFPEPSPKYARSKGKRGKGQLERTGGFQKAIRDKRVPASTRTTTVKKLKKEDTYRIATSVSKIVKGKNVYAIAQYGVPTSDELNDKAAAARRKRKKRARPHGNLRRRMVAYPAADDGKFYAGRIEEQMRDYLRKKAERAARAGRA